MSLGLILYEQEHREQPVFASVPPNAGQLCIPILTPRWVFPPSFKGAREGANAERTPNFVLWRELYHEHGITLDRARGLVGMGARAMLTRMESHSNGQMTRLRSRWVLHIREPS